MAMRRLPRTLPGSEPLMVTTVALGIYLGMAVVFLALNAATAPAIGAHGGHLPWPIVQWAVTTPLARSLWRWWVAWRGACQSFWPHEQGSRSPTRWT